MASKRPFSTTVFAPAPQSVARLTGPLVIPLEALGRLFPATWSATTLTRHS